MSMCEHAVGFVLLCECDVVVTVLQCMCGVWQCSVVQCVCVLQCVCDCTPMGGQRRTQAICSIALHLTPLNHNLSLTLGLDQWPQTSSDPPVFLPPHCTGLQACKWPHLAVYMNAEHLNSGCHAHAECLYQMSHLLSSSILHSKANF